MSVVSSPVRSAGTGSPGFRSQRKMSAGTIIKKIQTLEDTIESLRQQLVFTRSEEEERISNSNVVAKKNITKEPKQPKEVKEKMSAATATKQKKTQNAADEEKDKIPMPWTGQADFATCVGLKAQYGLFIQCGKACDLSSTSFQIDNHECRFCNDCSKKCDENGKHPVGTIEERIEAGVGKYVNAKTGKKETMYIEVLEKMNITKEQALESAAKRGFQIPDWMLEKAEKKRGRPPTSTAAAAAAASASAAAATTAAESGNLEEKIKKSRQPRAKKTATASVVTTDTPQKNSVQSSNFIDLNVVDSHADASSAAAPQEKKKRGRPTKSNTQSNVGESEMQKLIALATTEKKKRLSLDPEICSSDSQESGERMQIETQLTFKSDEEQEQQNMEDDDGIFKMFDEMIEEEENQQKQNDEQQSNIVTAAATATTAPIDVVTVATNDKKEKSKKKTKKSEKDDDDESESEKKNTKKKAAAKNKKAAEEEAAAAAAKKKAEEEAAAAAARKKAEEEAKKNESDDDETETEDECENESGHEEEEEELECEEYEYEGETYGLAPNGDIYSQDGNLVGKLTNGIANMF